MSLLSAMRGLRIFQWQKQDQHILVSKFKSETSIEVNNHKLTPPKLTKRKLNELKNTNKV